MCVDGCGMAWIGYVMAWCGVHRVLVWCVSCVCVSCVSCVSCVYCESFVA